MKVYLTLMAIAALVTYVATPAMRHLAFRVGAITAVRARDVHTAPIPRLGGVAIFLGLGVASTIVDATGARLRIVRQGGISLERIVEIVGEDAVAGDDG